MARPRKENRKLIKKRKCIGLSAYIVEFLDNIDASDSHLIENAIVKHYKLKPPKG